ncbi:MAG TPA: ABC transporter substrate-binding protein [Candidatus Limnocylindria bacterium]|nr:ABC transporter substrate-binding protein [Candidatus Limnocylindria bacterium]
MTQKRLFGTSLVLAVAAALVIGACGGAPSTPSSAPSAAPVAKPFQGTKEFSVSFTSIGLSSVPLLAAIDALRGDGFAIKTPEIAESELSVEGTAKGDFAFSSGTTSAVLTAIEKGGKLKIIADRAANEWTVFAKKGLATCADLNGKKVAIHSAGAVSTAMLKNWVNTTCKGTPDYVVVPGSPNRLAALLANQIDASPLELSDSITLKAKGGDNYQLVTSFAQTLPNVHPTTVYANSDFMSKNPDTVKALLKALLTEHRKIGKEAGYLKTITLKYYPSVDKTTIDDAAKSYVDLKIFDPNGGLTEANFGGTIEFFAGAGSIKAGMTVSTAADLSYLQAVLGELGRQ